MSDHFEEWAANCTLGTMLTLRKMHGTTFTESDRTAITDALHTIETALVQPFGPTERAKAAGGVDWPAYQKAQIMLALGCFQLRDSGKLAALEVDSYEEA